MAARLGKELKGFQQAPLDWATVAIEGDNLYKWNIILQGPDNSVYEKGYFKITLEIPADYPFKAPKVTFNTKVYHPNVLQKDGSICSAILNDNWSPQLKLMEVLVLLREMLAQPNIDSPLEEEVAAQFRDNRSAFDKTAKEWTKKHAKK